VLKLKIKNKYFSLIYLKMLLNGQMTVQQLLADLFSQIKLTVQNLIAQAMLDMNLPVIQKNS